MELLDRKSQLEVLEWDECVRLLETQDIGRLGVVDAFHPMIFPVNFTSDGDMVVFRTDTGSKLRAFGQDVCFEVDHFDRDTKSGWSVVIKGTLDEVTPLDRPEFVARVRALPIEPWAAGDKSHWMWIRVDSITGRRIAPRPLVLDDPSVE